MRYPKLNMQGSSQIQFPHFDGGLDLSKPRNQIADNALFDVKNMWVKDGYLQTRPKDVTQNVAVSDNLTFSSKSAQIEIEGEDYSIFVGENKNETGVYKHLTFFKTLANREDNRFFEQKFTLREEIDLEYTLVSFLDSIQFKSLKFYYIQGVLFQALDTFTFTITKLADIIDNGTKFKVVTPKIASNFCFYKGKPSVTNGSGLYFLLKVEFGMPFKLVTRKIFELTKDFNLIEIFNNDLHVPHILMNGKGNNYHLLNITADAEIVKSTILDSYNILPSAAKCTYMSDSMSYLFNLPFKNVSNEEVSCKVDVIAINNTEINDNELLFFNYPIFEADRAATVGQKFVNSVGTVYECIKDIAANELVSIMSTTHFKKTTLDGIADELDFKFAKLANDTPANQYYLSTNSYYFKGSFYHTQKNINYSYCGNIDNNADETDYFKRGTCEVRAKLNRKNGKIKFVYQGCVYNDDTKKASVINNIYSSRTSYRKEDFCIYNDKMYQAIENNYNKVPTNINYWAEVGNKNEIYRFFRMPFSQTNNIEVIAYPGSFSEFDELLYSTNSLIYSATNNINSGAVVLLSGYKNTVRWSDIDNPLYFPLNNYTNLGASDNKVTALIKTNNNILAFKNNEIYSLTFVDMNVSQSDIDSGIAIDYQANSYTFKASQVSNIGCDLPKTIAICGEKAVWANSNNRIYCLLSFSNSSKANVARVSDVIENKLKNIDFKNAFAAHWQGHYFLISKNQIFLLDYNRNSFGNVLYQNHDNKPNLKWYYWELDKGYSFGFGENSSEEIYLFTTSKDDGSSSLEGLHFDLSQMQECENYLVTKQFDFNSFDTYKVIEQIAFLFGNQNQATINPTISSNFGETDLLPLEIIDTNLVNKNKYYERVAINPRLFRVNSFGIKLSSNKPMQLQSMSLKYKFLGSVK